MAPKAKAAESEIQGSSAGSDTEPKSGNQATAGGDQQGTQQELRQDGPTLAEYVAAGYKAENYPPQGYARREEPVTPALVKMHRELLPHESGPATADVHPDEVENYNRHGWRRTEPKAQ